MSLASGLASQMGVSAAESTYGLPVVADRFFPILSGGMDVKDEPLESKATIAGRRLMDSTQHVPGPVSVTGSPGFELTAKSIGRLMKYAFGAVSTSGPVSGVYQHTFTPGDLSDDIFTAQYGIPDTGGTVRPMTYPGCMVSGWELACSSDSIATFAVDLVARREIGYRTVADGVTTSGSPTVTSATAAFTAADVGVPISGTGIPASSFIGVVNSATSVGLSSSGFTNTPVNASASGTGVTVTVGIALASASYAAGMVPMSYLGGSLSIGGSLVCASSISLKGDNGLSGRRPCPGSPYTRQPLEAAWRKYTGTVEAEFESRALYDRFVNKTESALVFTIADPTGAQHLDITANVLFTGKTPNVNGQDLTKLSLPFTVYGPATDAAGITAVWNTTESTP